MRTLLSRRFLLSMSVRFIVALSLFSYQFLPQNTNLFLSLISCLLPYLKSVETTSRTCAKSHVAPFCSQLALGFILPIGDYVLSVLGTSFRLRYICFAEVANER